MKSSADKRIYKGYEQIWETSIITQRADVRHDIEIGDISDTEIEVNRDRDEDIEMEIYRHRWNDRMVSCPKFIEVELLKGGL